MLGVVIGIAAVTTMVSIGQSAGALVQNHFQPWERTSLSILPGTSRRGGVRQAEFQLTANDSAAMREECPRCLLASSLVASGGQVIYRNVNLSPKEMIGVGADYLTVRNWKLRSGGFFTKSEVESGAKVCVIGHTLVSKLFQTTNPIGKAIRIRNIPFRVIGVLEKKGANMVGDDQDNIVLMPHTTVRRRLYGSTFNNVHAIMASARSPSQMNAATNQIRQLLLERHDVARGEKPDFMVQNTTEIADALGIITGTLTLMLSAIAGISFLVGGVGIMNIMLVSVTEQTREIGISDGDRRAGKDILRQFLIESVVLSCIGGAIGLVVGTAASAGATLLINTYSPSADWPMVISFPAAAVAMGFAAAVGIFFGYYPAPARKPARSDRSPPLRVAQMALIELRDVRRVYDLGETKVSALSSGHWTLSEVSLSHWWAHRDRENQR